MALEAKKRGMKVNVYVSASETGDKAGRHSSEKNLFQLADIVVDTCVPLVDASVPLKNHFDKVGPVSYTHLDVYKRQLPRSGFFLLSLFLGS